MNKKIALVLIPLLITSTMLLSLPWTSAEPEILKIGIISPYGLPHGEIMYGGTPAGAELAALEINATGGINIGGTQYLIDLVYRDEHCYPTIDPDAARQSVQELIAEGCRIIIGGFRTETTSPIIDEVLKWNNAHPGDEVILLINGASTDDLCVNWTASGNEAYRFIFRVNPVNGTMLFSAILGYLQGYLIPYKLAPMYGAGPNPGDPKVKYAVIAEDLTWTIDICNYLQYIGLGNLTQWVATYRTPAGTTDFTTYLDDAAAKGAALMVHIYTLPDVVYLVSQWGAGQYPFILVGIDVPGQWVAHVDNTMGLCQYEAVLDFSGTRTPIIPDSLWYTGELPWWGTTEGWWDRFVGNFSAWPMYTAWGAYNALLTLKNALEQAGSLDPFDIVLALEETETTEVNGIARFTYQTHDVFSNEYGPLWTQGYTRAMVVQWINNSAPDAPLNIAYKGFRKEVLSPIDQPYSRKFKFPPWIYQYADYDINFDGKVDVRDIFAAAKAYGSYPGVPNWNLECDVITDGKVDVRDIFAIALNYGASAEVWPLPDP